MSKKPPRTFHDFFYRVEHLRNGPSRSTMQTFSSSKSNQVHFSLNILLTEIFLRFCNFFKEYFWHQSKESFQNDILKKRLIDLGFHGPSKKSSSILLRTEIKKSASTTPHLNGLKFIRVCYQLESLGHLSLTFILMISDQVLPPIVKFYLM